MVKEERSLRTRLAAGSKRRIARRTQRRFVFQADVGVRDRFAAQRGLELHRLHTTTKPSATTRLNRFDIFEADAMPNHPSVPSLLVRPQPPLPAGRPSPASAAH